MELEACLIAVALAMSLWLRPWRMLSRQAVEKEGPSEPSPLVTPLLATLVRDLLGIDLAKTEVGGRLGCTEGAELVF